MGLQMDFADLRDDGPSLLAVLVNSRIV